MQRLNDLSVIRRDDLNIIRPQDKSIIDKQSAFIRELEITKHKLEIKPRKVNIMQAQIGMIADVMSEEPTKKLYVPGINGGFK